jgi:hypothetical protein
VTTVDRATIDDIARNTEVLLRTTLSDIQSPEARALRGNSST